MELSNAPSDESVLHDEGMMKHQAIGDDLVNSQAPTNMLKQKLYVRSDKGSFPMFTSDSEDEETEGGDGDGDPVNEDEKDVTIRELTAELSTVRLESREEIRSLKSLLVLNFVYGRQVTPEDAKEFYKQSRRSLPGFARRIPNLEPCTTFLLADDFTDMPWKPNQEHFQLDLYFKTLVDTLPPIMSTGGIYLGRVRDLNYHLCWLGGYIAIPSIYHTKEIIASSFLIIMTILGMDKLPLRIGRQSLFMIVANLTLRMSTDTDAHWLWFEVIEALKNREFGKPYKNWNTLDMVCFAWLLSSGPDWYSLDLGFLELDSETESAIKMLAGRVTIARPWNFIDLLRNAHTWKCLPLENPNTHYSEVLFLKNSAREELALMRTVDKLDGGMFVEYTWTRCEGKVWFSSSGIAVTIQPDESSDGTSAIFIQPISKGKNLPLFCADDTMMIYIQNHHNGLLRDALDDLCQQDLRFLEVLVDLE